MGADLSEDVIVLIIVIVGNMEPTVAIPYELTIHEGVGNTHCKTTGGGMVASADERSGS